MWDLIVSVPDHCLSFYFVKDLYCYLFLVFFFLSNLCATPTPAIMVGHDQVQYQEKQRKKSNNNLKNMIKETD